MLHFPTSGVCQTSKALLLLIVAYLIHFLISESCEFLNNIVYKLGRVTYSLPAIIAIMILNQLSIMIKECEHGKVSLLLFSIQLVLLARLASTAKNIGVLGRMLYLNMEVLQKML